jgi:hypothetical protein
VVTPMITAMAYGVQNNGRERKEETFKEGKNHW